MLWVQVWVPLVKSLCGRCLAWTTVSHLSLCSHWRASGFRVYESCSRLQPRDHDHLLVLRKRGRPFTNMQADDGLCLVLSRLGTPSLEFPRFMSSSVAVVAVSRLNGSNLHRLHVLCFRRNDRLTFVCTCLWFIELPCPQQMRRQALRTRGQDKGPTCSVRPPNTLPPTLRCTPEGSGLPVNILEFCWMFWSFPECSGLF